ncbi:PRTRC genetic system protein F [Paraburkholderia sp. GAS199]|uniref:PRTRC system protein F n=1 Tax=Paraburkholderia sp. GAS199 TaxID=3035126 RepID=UPI003D1C5ACC
MLFDPSFVDRTVEEGTGAAGQSPGTAVARYRSSDCVLTLPAFASDVPEAATVQYRSDTTLDGIVLQQFRHGPLLASDVSDPKDPVDAFQQAFFSWVGRQVRAPLRFLSFDLELFDTNAVEDVIEHQYEKSDFKPTSPLHLGLKLENEWVHEMGERAQPLRDAHPLLLKTLFSLVDRVSAKTILIRTPGWFLSETACRHWNGDENATDEESREWLAEMYGDDEEEFGRYLPSALRPAICPDDIRIPVKPAGRRSRNPALSERELSALQSGSTGPLRQVCTELLALARLLRRAGKRPLFGDGYNARPLYSGCTLYVEQTGQLSEMLDDYLEGEFQNGEASVYENFITFSNTREGIREQYAQWSLALNMLHHLDRLLALVVSG